MDFTNLDLPIGVIIFLLILNATKDVWVKLLPDSVIGYFASKEADKAHIRELEESKLDYELQKRTADESQEQLRDAQFNKYFDRMMSLIEETILNGQVRIGQRLETVENSLTRNRRAMLEMAGLLGALYSAAKQENGKMIVNVIENVDSILEKDFEDG